MRNVNYTFTLDIQYFTGAYRANLFGQRGQLSASAWGNTPLNALSNALTQLT